MKLLLAVLMMVLSSAVIAEELKYLRTEKLNSTYLLCQLSGKRDYDDYKAARRDRELLAGEATVTIENLRHIYNKPEENFSQQRVEIGADGNPLHTLVIVDEVDIEDRSNENEYIFCSKTPKYENKGNYRCLTINRITGTLAYASSQRSYHPDESWRLTKEFYGTCEKQTKQKF